MSRVLARGMASYAVVWPLGSASQQLINGEPLHWPTLARYSLYGSLYVAPTLHIWMKIASTLWPNVTLAVSIKKVPIVILVFTFNQFLVCVGYAALLALPPGNLLF